MAITLTGVGGLFTRLGKLAKVARSQHLQAGGNLTQFTADAIAALGSQSALAAPLPDALARAQVATGSIAVDIQAVAAATLCKMVNDDTPQADPFSVELALRELIRQMKQNTPTYYVPAMTTGVTATANSANSGDGPVVVCKYRDDNYLEQSLMAETGLLQVTRSAAADGGNAGQEPWSFSGDYAASDPLNYDWPLGSGSQAAGNAIDAQTYAPGAGNMIQNGGFETWSATDQPTSWTYKTGVATTHYGQEASVVHRGASALRLKGNGSTVHRFGQPLLNMRADRMYAFNLWARASAGTLGLTVFLDTGDLSNNTVFGNNGFDPLNTYGSGTLSTSAWTNVNGLFAVKHVPPTAGVALSIGMGSAIANGQSVYVDSVAVAEVSRLYPGGPGLAVFSGATPFASGDRWDIAVANNRAGATYGGTWSAYFDRWFDMRGLGLQLPYVGDVAIPDTLISA